MSKFRVTWSQRKTSIMLVVVSYCILGAGSMLMLFPFLWAFVSSFKVPGKVFVIPPQWIPDPFTTQNYVDIFLRYPFPHYIRNSLIVTLIRVAGVTLTSTLAAYAFARIRFPGRDQLFLVYLATMMVPFFVVVIPLYQIIDALNWRDTLYALSVPLLAHAYTTFLLRQFFLTIPQELEDSAEIDGAGRLRIFGQIMLPLCKPALATVMLFQFVWSWNDFFWPLIVTETKQSITIPVAIAQFKRMFETAYNLQTAATVVALLPVFVIFLFVQRFFIRGIILSGLKG